MVLTILEMVDSTQIYLKDLLSKQGFQSNIFILAKDQTQGYGRLGAPWYTHSGESFILSFSFQLPKSCKEQEIVFFVAGVLSALLDARKIEHQIKWPNDIYIKGRKLSGVLVERHLEGFVIGVGLNLNQESFSQDQAVRPISLFEVSLTKTDPQDFFTQFHKQFTELFIQWSERKFLPIKEACKNLYWKNLMVEIELPNNLKEKGLLQGLNEENGAVVLKMKDEEVKEFYAGRLRKI